MGRALSNNARRLFESAASKGILVALTGLDGSGKDLVAEELLRRDPCSRIIKTPGEVFQGSRSLIDEMYLQRPSVHYQYYLSSVINASEEAKLQLQKGDVYMVRYLMDTVAYHRVLGVDADLTYETRSYSIRRPDITVFLSVNETVRRKRIERRGM